VLFILALALVETLELAELRGELKKTIASLLKFDLLINNGLGYLPMNRQGLHNLFQLINRLYEYRSVILTTNKDFTNWGELFRDENLAVPIVDRLIHHSQVFMLGGESYRLSCLPAKGKEDSLPYQVAQRLDGVAPAVRDRT